MRPIEQNNESVESCTELKLENQDKDLAWAVHTEDKIDVVAGSGLYLGHIAGVLEAF